MTPKFTDSHRFSGGAYVPASKTDVSKTFARVRKEMAKAQQETRKKVQPIRRKA